MTYWKLGAAPTDSKQGQILEFFKIVSPNTDPASILLFAQMAQTQRLFMQIVEKRLARAGLSWLKFRILINLLRNETLGDKQGLQPSELSTLESVPRNSISDLLVSLEHDGLVRRELHPTDRRKFVIRLSPKGRKLVRATVTSQYKFVTDCFATLDPQEREGLNEMLQRLRTAISARQDEA